MARLPGPEDLGEVNPGSGERPIGSIGGAASAIDQASARLGIGVEQLGEGLGSVADAKSRFNYGMARAGFVADMIDHEQNTLRDMNYGPDASGQDLVTRFQNVATALRDKWAGTLGGSGWAQRFSADAQEQIAQGAAHVRGHAFALQGNHEIAATAVAGQNLQNKAAAVDDPAMHAQAMDAYGNAVDGLVGRGFIDEPKGLALKQSFASGLGEALIKQQAETDPLGALNHLRAVPGSDDELTERIIQIESGGNPSARNPSSSAAGLGQFTNSTWLDLIKSQHPELAQGRSDQDLLALRADPNLSREMTTALLQQNRSSLQSQGLEPSGGNLYLSHFLGAGGATAVLKANPNTPVAALLDPKVIAANPSILAGRTARSVTQWASDKMGGYAPGQGSIYSFIPPERRAELAGQLTHLVQAQQVGDRAQLASDQQDAEAEALNVGSVSNPIPLERFVATYGADEGALRYQEYDTAVQTGRTVAGLAALAPDQRQATVESLAPTPGEPGYAIKARSYDAAQSALSRLQGEQSSDPGQFAIQRLPAVNQAWRSFSSVLSDPSASEDQRTAAARDFATRTAMEQRRVGIAPDDVRLLPKSYADSINKSLSDAASSDDAQARLGLIAKVQQQARMWGSSWPQVMRQLAPQTQPIVRAIAAGADPAAMTRLLSMDPKVKPAALLKEQDATKAGDLNKAINRALAPFRSSMVGRQLDRDYPGYYNLATELGALHVRDGDDPDAAAGKAFNELVGNRYDFRDSYRIPKSAVYSANDVQAGTIAARSQLASLGAKPPIADVPGATPEGDLADIGRDGKWVTAPDNSGLNLAYGDKFVRTNDGAPLKLTWDQLAKLGGTVAARNAQVTANAVPAVEP